MRDCNGICKCDHVLDVLAPMFGTFYEAFQRIFLFETLSSMEMDDENDVIATRWR